MHKKIITIFVALLLVFLPALAFAGEDKTEVDSLLEQISSLLSLVESLQKQVIALSGENPTKTQGTYSFNRNLKLGDSGIDVKALQMALNKDKRTKIADFGPGSPGNETEYFGKLTGEAVSRFQELFSKEILAPAGLSAGNGFVGPSTRKKLQAIYSENTNLRSYEANISGGETKKAQENENTTTSQKKIDENIEKTDVLSHFLSPEDYSLLNDLYNSEDSQLERSFALGSASSYKGAPGEKIVLDGRDLTDDINIHFNDYAATGTALNSGKELVFTVPDIEKGPYELTFTKNSGEKALRVMDFVIVVEGAINPEIYSIEPPSGPLGTEITINGINFAKENNTVNFGQRAVTGIPSEDGTSIVVPVVSDIFMPANVPNPDNANWPIWVFVANENGNAPVPAIFLIEI